MADYSERDIVLLKREAFIAGAEWWSFHTPADERAEAKKRYPMPTRTVPRVVPDPQESDLEWRVVNGAIEFMRPSGTPWTNLRLPDSKHGYIGFPTSARIRVWYDLLSSPTVEEDEEE